MWMLKLMLWLLAIVCTGLGAYLAQRAIHIRIRMERVLATRPTWTSVEAEEYRKKNGTRCGAWIVLPFLLVSFVLITIASSMVDIRGDGFGVMTRNFGGGPMPSGAIVAVSDENGPQAKLLPPKLNFIVPFMYSAEEKEPYIIPEGQIGIVTTMAGKSMEGMIYAPPWSSVDDFLNPETFLSSEKGFKGQQITLLLPGTWKPHPGVYGVTLADMVNVEMGHIKVVKANWGPEPVRQRMLTVTEVIEKEVPLSKEELEKAYLEAEASEKRRQMAAGIPEDRINITRGSLKVPRSKLVLTELKKEIPDPLVDENEQGILRNPLLPGKYPMHPRAYEYTDMTTMKVRVSYTPPGEEGPEDHRILVRSKEGYEFPLDIRVVYHIEAKDGPLVRALVGDDELVESTVVTPAVMSIARVLAGRSNVLDFLAELEFRQRELKDLLSKKCGVYGVTIDEALIGRVGDEKSLGDLMKTQRDREIAAQQQITFAVQQKAAEQQKLLNKAQQGAEEEKKLAQAAYAVTIAEQRKQETIKNAEAQAEQKKIAADAEATRLLKIKTAEAEGYRLKVAALGAPAVAMLESLQLISDGKINITPTVMVNGGGTAGTMDALMGTILGQTVRK